MNTIQSDTHYHGCVVVFDLDDTLFSEKEHAVQAYSALANLPEFATPWLCERIKTVMSEALDERKNPFDALLDFLSQNGVTPLSSESRLVEAYRRYEPKKLTLYPDAKELLDALRERGVRVGLVTDGRSFTQRAKLKALGIEDYFHPADILISEETGHNKSEIDNFVTLVHHYPEAAMFCYVADNQAKDFEIPCILGWETFCLLDRGQNIHPQTDTEGNYHKIKRLTELLNHDILSTSKV